MCIILISMFFYYLLNFDFNQIKQYKEFFSTVDGAVNLCLLLLLILFFSFLIYFIYEYSKIIHNNDKLKKLENK